MMLRKLIITILILFTAHLAEAQFNNEWIDYNKTYYKFKVGVNGLYRIPLSVLQAAGLGSVPAEQFQLWRNGAEVPLYTSVSAGALGSNDFIEFFGQQNDGKPDAALYKTPSMQLADRWSLQTDTAAFFLTVNPAGPNARLTDEGNDVAGNTLAAEPYFLNTLSVFYKQRINYGFAAVVGEYVYSSTYENGEGWASRDVYSTTPLIDQYTNLYVSPAGPDPKITVAASGNALNTRKVLVTVNGIKVMEEQMDYFNAISKTATFPLSYLGRPTDTIRINNNTTNTNDRLAVAKYEMTYPRTFNFGGASLFEFNLQASPAGNYLEITNFNAGGGTPVIYDLTNGKRYTANTAVPGTLRFALLPSGARKLVLLATAGSNLKTINSLNTRNFVDFSNPQQQGNYLIISHSRLFSGPSGNPVENYRQYRSSAEGGGYNAKIYDIEQLVDQFAFGIKMHPSSVKNFLKFARSRFSAPPAFAFIIGRGLTYDQYRINEALPGTENIGLIPTFGSPASDNTLGSDGYDPVPETPVGRLAAVYGSEVEKYLLKVKQHENAIKTGSQTMKDRGWMKNVVHAIGGSDPYLQAVIYGFMNNNKDVIEDTSFGGKVYSFSKNSAFSVQQLTSAQLKALFEEGINILTYFGHSSANTLEFNLDDPSEYNNVGKYPMFIVNGCNAGNFFVYDTLRFSYQNQTLSEKYVLADQRGSIGFIASTHYGIVNYLNIYTYNLYSIIASEKYSEPIGVIQSRTLEKMLSITGPNDYYGRLHAEEICLQGDPAIRLYPHAAPDYVIEDPLVKIDPPYVSVADNNFEVKVRVVNIGKAVKDSIVIDVKRQLPSGVTVPLLNKKIKGVNYSDSLVILVPINPLTDKGENKLIVTADFENEVSEISETNNSVTKSFYIIEEEARPISPYNYSIVTKGDITFYASAANPFTAQKAYTMEIDTTELFNSPFKKTQNLNSTGGLLQFKPAGFTPIDGKVYYWRTAPVPSTGNDYVWNVSSFVYLPNSSPGYNQSHYFQMKKNEYAGINLRDDRSYGYAELTKKLKIRTGLYPYYDAFSIDVTLNEDYIERYGCRYSSLQIIVYDSINMQAWKNTNQPNGLGLYGSAPLCRTASRYFFEFPYADTGYRRRAMEFLESIPNGYYVSITNLGWTTNKSFIKDWMADTIRLGKGRSLYHTMKNMGLIEIDQFTKNLPFLFFFKKGVANFPIYEYIGPTESSLLEKSFEVPTRINTGTITSPWFGPALEWKNFSWKGRNLEAEPDEVAIEIRGRSLDGSETSLAALNPAVDTSLAFVDAKQFPYLSLRMYNHDAIHATPNQLDFWRVNGVPPPEGTIAPNLVFKSKDTLDIGEPLNFEVAFKNISEEAFDSLDVELVVTDKDNVTHVLEVPKKKPLQFNDTLVLSYTIETLNLTGKNTLFVNFNPNQLQPEQYLFNNFLFKDFYVRPDNYNPVLDVTFDGVHILNRDIVSARPHILIKLKDDNRFLALNDTSLMQVKIRKVPNGDLRTYRFDNDTLKFIPAQPGSSGDNTATIDFTPYFTEDGEYEMIVSGKDRSENTAGQIEYRVVFTIINKPMISNLLNYPNPFTTSTAFVFTVTGSEVPQNLRIQILTITGKIVREITREELGPIRIGRNITEFKWDGTDQYGQKLANGVYLYRVITNLNGKGLEKYKAEGDKTDQYFKAGYGKMYLMR
jgi:hypothetical protein